LEICEIVCKATGFLGFKSYFVARAAGSRGIYEAARSTVPFEAQNVFRVSKGGASEDVPCDGSAKQVQKARAALNEIMTQLASNGWRLDGKSGEGWWEYKYRR
jgi:hypothetical protein